MLSQSMPSPELSCSPQKEDPTCHDSLQKMTSRNSTDTRSSSKHIFPYISCIPRDSIFYCFILSVWDNIVGPQTAFVWKKKKQLTSTSLSTMEALSCSDPSNKMLSNDNNDSKIKNQAISGPNLPDSEITYESSNGMSQEKFNKVVAEQEDQLNLASVLGYVTERAVGVGENSLSNSKKITSLFLVAPCQNIIVLSIKFCIIEEGVAVAYCLSAVIPSANESELLPVKDLCADSLMRIAAETRVIISKEGLEGGHKIQGSLMELCNTLLCLRDASLDQYLKENVCCQPDDRRLAERMLTSHLQTMGTTLVIADSPSEANKVVMWLAQFLNENDLHISRIALSNYRWSYQPGITIQAVIRDPSGGIDLSSCKLLCSKHPVTLIDLTSNTVRQTAPIHIHSKNSATAFRHRLLALWHGLDHVPAPSQTAERRRREQKSLLQVISSTFQLEEADLKVVLAQAELLQPGFTAVVFE